MIFKNILFLIITGLSFLFFVNSCSNDEDSSAINDSSSFNKQKTNCANYPSQNEAQAAFDSDPIFFTKLDFDNDGIACEEPGNNVKPKPICATTANCGCSGKRKSACENDLCCKWRIGDGCKCN